MYYIDPSAIVICTDCGDDSKIYKNTDVRHCFLDKGVVIGDFTRMSDCNLSEMVSIQRNGLMYSVNMGRYSYTGRNFTAWHVSIGGFCSISWNVSIGGANHDYNKVSSHAFLYSDQFGLNDGKKGYDRFDEPCNIGHDVWLGAHVIVSRGVTIGNGAVVGSGAVVTKDVEPYTIVAGVPAKPIKKRFSEHIIKELQEIEWWSFDAEVIRGHFDIFNSLMDDAVLDKLKRLKDLNDV